VATQTINAKGLPCPQPALKMTVASINMKKGEILEAVADCPTFEADVRGWCERSRKALLWIRVDPDGAKRCQVRI
jgi:tRNA 2-thiouridine synthesizing protein A